MLLSSSSTAQIPLVAHLSSRNAVSLIRLDSSNSPLLSNFLFARFKASEAIHFAKSPLLTFSMLAPKRIPPGPGQESVWDYPRPPKLEKISKHITVIFNDQTIADTREAYRVLETSHPPIYYIPQKDIRMEYLVQSPGSSYCEWKGSATYWTVNVSGSKAPNAGWSYEKPTSKFLPIRSHIAFYCAPMSACHVDGEVAKPQDGGFYGGWVTSDILGPFKGGPGTWGW